MVIVFVTKQAHDSYLNLIGYMFEQSHPLQGMAFNSPYMYLSPLELIDITVNVARYSYE